MCPQSVSTRLVSTDTGVQRHRIHLNLCHGACVNKVCPHGSCPQTPECKDTEYITICIMALVSTKCVHAVRVHSLCPQFVSTVCVHKVCPHGSCPQTPECKDTGYIKICVMAFVSTKRVHTVRVPRHRSAKTQNALKFVSWRLCPQSVSTRIVSTDTGVQRHRIH